MERCFSLIRASGTLVVRPGFPVPAGDPVQKQIRGRATPGPRPVALRSALVPLHTEIVLPFGVLQTVALQ
ncbi:MAG: hypothetical protein HONDAALG_03074 [Gammaproteobacteria bacterium]|nr:hypothetical protein [Gammaproteobacteria bacterium]